MNKLKALLIAGLLSLSSVSFAMTVTTYTTEYIDSGISQVASGHQAGTITLEDTGTATFAGLMGASDPLLDAAGTATAWYQLDINFSGLSSFGKIANTVFSNPQLTYSFLNLDGSSFNTAYEGMSGLFEVGLASGSYKLVLSGDDGMSYDGDISAVPVPAAGILFASALFGAGALGRRKKKSAKTSMVGAFARAS